jgi:hypothetical protein
MAKRFSGEDREDHREDHRDDKAPAYLKCGDVTATTKRPRLIQQNKDVN